MQHIHQCFILLQLQHYDISTLYVGSASQMEQNPNTFKRKIYIKFDLNSEELFKNFDEFASKLDSEDQPTEIMRNSIKIHTGLSRTQIGGM